MFLVSGALLGVGGLAQAISGGAQDWRNQEREARRFKQEEQARAEALETAKLNQDEMRERLIDERRQNILNAQKTQRDIVARGLLAKYTQLPGLDQESKNVIQALIDGNQDDPQKGIEQIGLFLRNRQEFGQQFAAQEALKKLEIQAREVSKRHKAEIVTTAGKQYQIYRDANGDEVSREPYTPVTSTTTSTSTDPLTGQPVTRVSKTTKSAGGSPVSSATPRVVGTAGGKVSPAVAALVDNYADQLASGQTALNRVPAKLQRAVSQRLKDTGRSAMPTVAAAARAKGEQAQVVRKTGTELLQWIDQHPQAFGFSVASLNDAVQSHDHLVAQAATLLRSFAALQPALHGSRGIGMQREFEDAVGKTWSSPAVLKARISSLMGIAKNFETAAGLQDLPGTEESTSPGETELYFDANGNPVKKP